MPDTTLAPAIDPGGMMDRPGVDQILPFRSKARSTVILRESICLTVFELIYLIGMY